MIKVSNDKVEFDGTPMELKVDLCEIMNALYTHGIITPDVLHQCVEMSVLSPKELQELQISVTKDLQKTIDTLGLDITPGEIYDMFKPHRASDDKPKHKVDPNVFF